MTAYTPTPGSRVRRLPKRARYDRATVHAILDAAFVCHVGYIIAGQPYVTPTAFWRDGDRLYWHGSSASRMLRQLGPGLPTCLTVTHLDGLVIARSAFHHSVNYRSAMAFGMARKIDDPAEKESALRAFVARLYPGRWPMLRPMNAQEFKGTTVLGMAIEEASAKIRTGPPIDDEADYGLRCWAGTVGMRTVVGETTDDPRLAPDIARPLHLASYVAGERLDDVLGELAPSGRHRRPPRPNGRPQLAVSR